MSAEDRLQEFMLPQRLERLESVLEERTRSTVIVLDHVHNFHNISAVIRTADAFGINDIYLVGEDFEYSRGISLGAERWVDLKKYNSAKESSAALIADGYQIVVLQPQNKEGTNTPVFELPFSEKLALIFGNEHSGVSKEFIEAANYRAFIPMLGFVESLNISVAAAITMFCSTFSDASATRQVQPLAEDDKDEIKKKWLKNSVRHSEAILRAIDEDKNQ